MSFRSPLNTHACVPHEPATASQYDTDGELDMASVRSPDPRNGHVRRPRFGDAIADTPIRPTTGAIAVSFAIVSRKHWPR
ncbi:MAG: hypothetical protein QOC89_4054 [Paraburkholderia sp.]|jgi:hypothetical protein|uniref:hypothetical protein n=1 Tax=Paraburkholderia sp. TaxID=1926495 RepID=UPI002AFE65AC|nr:hypothetical protein [Paraburkholderia sp.]MEA3086357.1 hypothetical protein [Paraburkholderia sp.]